MMTCIRIVVMKVVRTYMYILKMEPKGIDLIGRIWGLEERAESRLVPMF